MHLIYFLLCLKSARADTSGIKPMPPPERVTNPGPACTDNRRLSPKSDLYNFLIPPSVRPFSKKKPIDYFLFSFCAKQFTEQERIMVAVISNLAGNLNLNFIKLNLFVFSLNAALPSIQFP